MFGALYKYISGQILQIILINSYLIFFFSCVSSDQCEDVKGAEVDFICDDPAHPICCFKSRIISKPDPISTPELEPEPKPEPEPETRPNIKPKIDQNKPISQPETNIYKKYTYKIIPSDDKIIFSDLLNKRAQAGRDFQEIFG